MRSLHDLPGNPYAGRRAVSLTFDDGPSPAHTPAVLEILDTYGVRATFFVTGSQVAANPDLVRTIAELGHRVEGHSWAHTDLRLLSEAAFSEEVDRTNALIEQLTGRAPLCVRPPFGAFDQRVGQRLGDRGLANALWTVDTRDWTRPGAAVIVDRAISGLAPGAVLLFHDGGGDRSQTVAALPAVLDAITRGGFEPVPMCG